MPDLSRPLFHHLQNGTDNLDFIELSWGKMKRCAYSALSWGLGWDCVRGSPYLPHPDSEHISCGWGGHTCPNSSFADGNVFEEGSGLRIGRESEWSMQSLHFIC